MSKLPQLVKSSAATGKESKLPLKATQQPARGIPANAYKKSFEVPSEEKASADSGVAKDAAAKPSAAKLTPAGAAAVKRAASAAATATQSTGAGDLQAPTSTVRTTASARPAMSAASASRPLPAAAAVAAAATPGEPGKLALKAPPARGRAATQVAPARKPAAAATAKAAPVEVTGLLSLPDELLHKIAQCMRVPDLLACAATCRILQRVCHQSAIWAEVSTRQWGTALTTPRLVLDRLLRERRRAVLAKCRRDPFTSITTSPQAITDMLKTRFTLCLHASGDTPSLFDRSRWLAADSVRMTGGVLLATWANVDCAQLSSLHVRVAASSLVGPFPPGALATDLSTTRSRALLSITPFAKFPSPSSPPVALSSKGPAARAATAEPVLCVADVTIAVYKCGPFIVGLWVKDSSVAFMHYMASLHGLVDTLLRGQSARPPPPFALVAKQDDIDPVYGLHDYQVTLLLSGPREDVYSEQFKRVRAEARDIETIAGQTFIRFAVVTHGAHHGWRGPAPALPWTAGGLGGIIKNATLLSVTVVDEHDDIFWTFSSATAFTSSADGADYEFSGEHLSCTTGDGAGHVRLRLEVSSEREYCSVVSFELLLSTAAIRARFGRDY
eukprot:m.90903 g.90903  ORF g.90903 m.90903 type:complete len:615 (+) comp13712_c0_seq1:39-1883(+)